MRPDMGKVLVERPRPGSREGGRPRKGYRREVQRAMERDDGGPAHEGTMRRYGSKRPFNEHLAPLRRFLDANTGRPWDKVYSEICQYVDRDNVVQKHILTHLFEYVIRETILIDGVPCLGTRLWPGDFGQPLREIRTSYDRWYVCPISGLLRKLPKTKRYRYSAQQEPKIVPVTRLHDDLGYRVLPTGVELVRLAPLPETWWTKKGYDVLLKRTWKALTEAEARLMYGRCAYATASWIATKKELKQYPVPFELIR